MTWSAPLFLWLLFVGACADVIKYKYAIYGPLRSQLKIKSFIVRYSSRPRILWNTSKSEIQDIITVTQLSTHLRQIIEFVILWHVFGSVSVLIRPTPELANWPGNFQCIWNFVFINHFCSWDVFVNFEWVFLLKNFAAELERSLTVM